ncbi:hypothetical protein JX265_007119 [Neoarthrinium moseri]|uniref:Enoyl reductase (ER) domain-containing protein n=1 Tax=Neoarthrinium moseri TaxID=1658444 RepID=A0A9P9WKI3_9PEZI|nr:hypothetical protein JX265_007119 [Neoarthrinium moseri]
MPKQAIIEPSIEAINIIDTPIPTPGNREVVIRVVVAGTNPKDWKYPLWTNWAHNSGDDMAGFVHSVGADVYEFNPGDRVAAYHESGKQHGTFAEYAVAPDWTTFHIPEKLSFEEAATVPTAALTAAVALYADMRLPPPYEGGDGNTVQRNKVPLLIYGISSAVGAFAAKLARLSGLGPIIGIAGRATEFANSLADHVVDYRQGEDGVVFAIEAILAKEGLATKMPYVFDAISENGSLETTLRLIDPDGGVVSTVLPPKLFARDRDNYAYPDGVKGINSAVPTVHSTDKDFGYLWSRYLGRLLEDGRLRGHPYEVMPGGLSGVLTALQKLKNGEASAVKYVCRIDETQDLLRSNVLVGKQVSGAEDRPQSHTSSHALRDFPFPS